MTDKKQNLLEPLAPFDFIGRAIEGIQSLAHEYGIIETPPPKRRDYPVGRSPQEIEASRKDARAISDFMSKFTEDELREFNKFGNCVAESSNRDAGASECDHLKPQFMKPKGVGPEIGA